MITGLPYRIHLWGCNNLTLFREKLQDMGATNYNPNPGHVLT